MLLFNLGSVFLAPLKVTAVNLKQAIVSRTTIEWTNSITPLQERWRRCICIEGQIQNVK